MTMIWKQTVETMNRTQNVFAFFLILLFILPSLGAIVPADAEASDEEQGWWVDTTVDRNKNGMGDMVELHIDNPIFLDDANTLPLIIDFDHTPDEEDIAMLEQSVGYQHQWLLRASTQLLVSSSGFDMGGFRLPGSYD